MNSLDLIYFENLFKELIVVDIQLSIFDTWPLINQFNPTQFLKLTQKKFIKGL